MHIEGPLDCKQTSRFCLLCHFNSIADLDVKISHRNFQLGMSKKELDCPKALRSPLDQHCLCSAHGVRTDAQTDAATLLSCLGGRYAPYLSLN